MAEPYIPDEDTVQRLATESGIGPVFVLRTYTHPNPDHPYTRAEVVVAASRLGVPSPPRPPDD